LPEPILTISAAIVVTGSGRFKNLANVNVNRTTFDHQPPLQHAGNGRGVLPIVARLMDRAVRFSALNRAGCWCLLAIVLVASICQSSAAIAQPVAEEVMEEEAEDEAEVPPKANPIGAALKRLFGPQAREDEGSEAEEDDTAAEGEQFNRAARDPKSIGLLRGARKELGAGNSSSAFEFYQKLLDLPEDSVVPTARDEWGSARGVALEEMAKLPAETLAKLRDQFAPLAQRLLNDARQRGDRYAIAKVAFRFLYTPAGEEAANELASRHIDLAEYTQGALWLERMSWFGGPLTQLPAWQAKASFVARKANSEALQNRYPADRELTVALGGKQQSLTSWLQTSESVIRVAHAKQQSEFPTVLGNASRRATASLPRPSLVAQRKHPFSRSVVLRQKIDARRAELEPLNLTLIPASVPISARGMVFYRDLQAVRAFNPVTGQVVWETEEGLSAHRMLTGLVNSGYRGGSNEVTQYDFDSQGTVGSFHPLTTFLYRDHLQGQIAADGDRLYLIEDQACLTRTTPGGHWSFEEDGVDPFGQDWSTNRLVAYDISTGRQVWSVGGRPLFEDQNGLLSKAYFLGVPVSDGETAYVLFSKLGEVRLAAIECATGRLRWTQLLAYSDSRIEQDIARRWFSGQPSITGGLIVCPTTVGWLVTVDAESGSIVWAQRTDLNATYNDDDGTPAAPLINASEIGQQWLSTPPLVTEGLVVSAPTESPYLYCFDLETGRERWKLSRSTSQYVAGLTQTNCVLVASDQVLAVRLIDGSTAQKHSFGKLRPTGRALLVQNELWVPLSGGTLRVLDIETLALVRELSTADGNGQLGNLVPVEGLLVSLTPDGVEVFGPEAEQSAQQLVENITNPAERLSLAQQAAAQRADSRVIELLTPIDTKALQEEQLTVYRQLFREAIVRRLAVSRSAADLNLLEKLAVTDDDRWQVETERYLLVRDQKSPIAAVKHVIDLSKSNVDLQVLVPRQDDPVIEVTRERWIANELAQLYNKSTPAQQLEFQQAVDQSIGPFNAATEEQLAKSLILYSFLPVATTMRLELAERLFAARNLIAAEYTLLPLLKVGHSSRPLALACMARICRKYPLPGDAAHFAKQLLAENPDFPGGQQIFDLAKKEIVRPAIAQWKQGPLKVEQFGSGNYQPPRQELLLSERLPSGLGLSAEIDQEHERLVSVSRDGSGPAWSPPLRAGAGQQQNSHAFSHHVSHRLLVAYNDVIHLFSPWEQRLLWAVPMEPQIDDGRYARHTPLSMRQSLYTADTMQGIAPLLSGTGHDRIVAVGEQYVAYRHQRTLTVLDGLTGRVIWRYSRLPANTSIVGLPERILLMGPARSTVELLHASDGTRLPSIGLGQLLGRTFTQSQNGLVLLEPGSNFLGVFAGKATLKCYDPVTQETRWSHKLHAKTLVGDLLEDELLLVEPEQTVSVLNAVTGQSRLLEPFPGEPLRSSSANYTLKDNDRIYIVAGNSSMAQVHYYAESIPSLAAQDRVIAWDRQTGKYLWTYQAGGQNLLIDRFTSSPALIFLSRTYQDRANLGYTTLRVTVISKVTGNVLHEVTIPTNYSGFHSLEISRGTPYVDLISYSSRLRVSPAGLMGPSSPPESPPEPLPVLPRRKE
jgi:outer membrane protein assembly factor BamB